MSSKSHQEKIQSWGKFLAGDSFSACEVASMLTNRGAERLTNGRCSQILGEMVGDGVLVKTSHTKWKRRSSAISASNVRLRAEYFEGEGENTPQYC